MPWSDFEQQQQFSPMGWLGGAGMPAPAEGPFEGQFEDPAVLLARRMRQQSPNVPAAPSRGGIGSDYVANGEPARSRGIGSDYAASVGMLPPSITGGGGTGSDFAASGGAGLPERQGGIGSDYAASGGAGAQAISPFTTPTNSSGFWNDFGKGARRVVPPWWLPENAPGAPGAPAPSRPGGIGSDYAAGQGPGEAAPAAPGLPPPIQVPMWPGDSPAVGQRANAQAPAASQQQPQQAQAAAPAQQQPPAPSLLDRIGNGINNNSELLLSLGAGFAGAPSLGAGMQRAFANSRPLMGRNQTVDALMKRGMPEDMARAAVANPDVLKQVLPQFFGAKQRKFTQIGEDMMGNKRYGFVDEVSNKVFDLGGNEISRSQQGADIPTGADGEPLRGPELLSHLKQNNPPVAAAIEGIMRGDVSAGGRNLQKLLPVAALVDPTLHQYDYANRSKTQQAFTTGKEAQNVKSLETVIGHLGDLKDTADKLGNTWSPDYNSVKNWLTNRTGGGGVKEFEIARNGVTNELGTVFRSHGMSDSEVHSWKDQLNNSASPQQFRSMIGRALSMLESRVDALNDQWRRGMGSEPADFLGKKRDKLEEIRQWANGTEAPAAAPGAAPAQAAPPANMPRFNSPLDATEAVRMGKIKRGDSFLDANGVMRVVP